MTRIPLQHERDIQLLSQRCARIEAAMDLLISKLPVEERDIVEKVLYGLDPTKPAA